MSISTTTSQPKSTSSRWSRTPSRTQQDKARSSTTRTNNEFLMTSRPRACSLCLLCGMEAGQQTSSKAGARSVRPSLCGFTISNVLDMWKEKELNKQQAQGTFERLHGVFKFSRTQPTAARPLKKVEKVEESDDEAAPLLTSSQQELVVRCVAQCEREDEEKAEQFAAASRRVEKLEQELHVLVAQCEKHERKIAALELQTAAALVPQVDTNKAEIVALKAELDGREHKWVEEKAVLHEQIRSLEAKNMALTQKCSELAAAKPIQSAALTNSSSATQERATQRKEARKLQELQTQILQGQKAHAKREAQLLQQLRESEANRNQLARQLEKLQRQCVCAIGRRAAPGSFEDRDGVILATRGSTFTPNIQQPPAHRAARNIGTPPSAFQPSTSRAHR
ncbi:hypothetical protein M3Y99_01551700 [Aphelenchoides fujianensis]|nr:hypothetical protein M3Y99_01551700 [Aphelenchoides fujianensis]